jgi:hypothetical protein
MKVSEVAYSIVRAASGEEVKKILTLKTICNSDTSFVAAVKKYQNFQKLLQKAFLLSRTWQKLGLARTWKITIKSLEAALKALASGFKRLDDLVDLPVMLRTQIDKLISSRRIALSNN